MVEQQTDRAALLAAALEHARDGQNVKAIGLFISYIEASPGDSLETAEAWRHLSFVYFSIANKRLRGHEARFQSAIDAFGKAIAIWRRGPHNDDFAYALHNFAAMNTRSGGGNIAAITLYEEALCILELRPDADGERRTATWNHLAHTYVGVGRLDDAECLLDQALKVVPVQSENAGYLNETLAFLYEAKAKVLREHALANRHGH